MILTPEESTLFYDIWRPLLQYANTKTRMYPNVNFKQDPAIDVQDAIEVADWIWEHTEIIDDYLKEHPSLKKDRREILKGWKRCIHDRWMVERHLKSGSVFLGKTPYAFLVQGIVSSFEEMIGFYGTPVMIEATLLPFRGKIITDGLVRYIPVIIGPGIKAGAKEEYMAAKKSGNLFSSLTDEVYRLIQERDQKKEEARPAGKVIPLRRDQTKAAKHEEDRKAYRGYDPDEYDRMTDDMDDMGDDDDDFFYDEEELPEENREVLALFEKDLREAGLSPDTVSRHLENTDLFLNEFVWGWEEAGMKEGVDLIENFFMDFFIGGWLWASPTSLRSTAASIKKFYKSMLDHKKISAEEYRKAADTIQSGKETWLEELRRLEEEEDDDLYW